MFHFTAQKKLNFISGFIIYLSNIFLSIMVSYIVFFKFFNKTNNFEIDINANRILFTIFQIFFTFILMVGTFIIFQKKILLAEYFNRRLFSNFKLNFLLITILLIFIVKTIITMTFTTASWQWKLFITQSMFFFFAAFFEEFLFRGPLYYFFLEKNHSVKYVPQIIQGSLFSLLHIHNPAFNIILAINLFLAGLILVNINQRYFLLGTLFHFLWNFIQSYFFGLNVSGYSFKDSLFKPASTILSWEYQSFTILIFALTIWILYKFKNRFQL